jgi:hypothetical protein
MKHQLVTDTLGGIHLTKEAALAAFLANERAANSITRPTRLRFGKTYIDADEPREGFFECLSLSPDIDGEVKVKNQDGTTGYAAYKSDSYVLKSLIPEHLITNQ